MGALSGADLEDAKDGMRFTTLRLAVDFAVILPLLACVLLIILVALGFTVLVAKLLSVFIDFLEKASTAFWYGRTKIWRGRADG